MDKTYKIKDDNFIIVQGWMISKLYLTGNKLLLYGMIHGFCQDGKTLFHGSVRYVSSFLGITNSTSHRLLQELIDDGLIQKIDDSKYSTVPKMSTAAEDDGVPKISTDCTENQYTSVPKISTNKYTKDNDKYLEDVNKLFLFWNNRDGLVKHTTLTETMKKACLARLKEGHDPRKMAEVIIMYENILKGNEYWLNQRWTFEEFFKRSTAFQKMVLMDYKDYLKRESYGK